MNLKKERIVMRVIIGVLSLFVATSIIPALLNADSDLSVNVGVIIVVGIIAGAFLYGKRIYNWFINV